MVRFAVARRFVQFQRDLSPREDLPVSILDGDGLFAYDSSFAAAARTYPAQGRRFQRKRAAMMANREKGTCLVNSPEELQHAEVAVGNHVHSHGNFHLGQNGTFLRMGVLPQHGFRDHPGRVFVHDQRLAGECRGTGVPQRFQSVFRARKHVAVEYIRREAGNGLGIESLHGADQLTSLLAGVGDDSLRNAEFGAFELAVEGRQRGRDLVAPCLEGGTGGTAGAASHIQHDVHQVRQRDFSFVLSRRVIREQHSQCLVIHQILQSKSADDRAGSTFHKRLKRFRQRHPCLPLEN